jgi:glycosyltransferase involved in cell wall biosynthesis
VDALAAAMDRLMSSEKERKHLSFRAVEICERFSREKVMGMWEELLAELSNC